MLADNIATIAKNEYAYKLMDEAVKIEKRLAKKSGCTWDSFDDTFNDLRKNYTIKSYSEAVKDNEFVIKTASKDTDNYWFAHNNLVALSKPNVKSAKYVVAGDDEKHAFVPATADNDIIPFLKCLAKSDTAFKNIL